MLSQTPNYRGYRFPAEIISYAVWLYYRFSLSFRDIEDLLAQRGTNENTNRLLRQYFPKGLDLSGYSQAQLSNVARQLNGRPRKTLGFYSPADKLSMVLR